MVKKTVLKGRTVKVLNSLTAYQSKALVNNWKKNLMNNILKHDFSRRAKISKSICLPIILMLNNITIYIAHYSK
jgi:hypothetical protein